MILNSKGSRYLPIIYVRGFAMSDSEKDQTAADPFCGFNLGSTVYRAVAGKDKPPRKFVFESPVVRLMSQYRYTDVYEDGNDILDPEWETYADGQKTPNRLTARSVIIYRYYDDCSELLGTQKKPDMERFARGLSELIYKVRYLLDANEENGIRAEDFKCYLVAHSMGGLICRALLQRRSLDTKGMAKCVDKVFTYATPHNGIDMAGMNVPSWLRINSINTFNRQRIADLLDIRSLAEKYDRVDLLAGSVLPGERYFTMVGTNRSDYEAAAGLSRTFVGHGSDGLVKIENATLCEALADGRLRECPKAFAYRSHSGYFGIVNSEEAFQNLARFLFGDLRVDISVHFLDVRLPDKVSALARNGRSVEALYQVEVQAAPRGKLWYLTRRMAEEDSVACFRHSEWMDKGPIRLSTVFLSNLAKVTKGGPSLAYSMTLAVKVPDYEVKGALWVNEHYEGAYLFSNALIVEIFKPSDVHGWKVFYAWQDGGVAAPKKEAELEPSAGGGFQILLDFDSCDHLTNLPSSPGVSGKLQLSVSPWNTEFNDPEEQL